MIAVVAVEKPTFTRKKMEKINQNSETKAKRRKSLALWRIEMEHKIRKSAYIYLMFVVA